MQPLQFMSVHKKWAAFLFFSILRFISFTEDFPNDRPRVKA
jgi:hypothetical protein